MKKLIAQDLHPLKPEAHMHTHALKLLILFISSLMASHANATHSSISLIETIKNEFIQIASSDITDYRLCELYSKQENKKEFVERTIKKSFTNNMKDIRWKEMQFREEAAKNNLHLGVIVIQYMNDKDAISIVSEVHARPANYLANSKILTRYIVLRDNDKVAFIYSETFIDDKIKSLFEKLEKSRSDNMNNSIKKDAL